MSEHLGMLMSEIGDDYLVATMPVDSRTLQPNGLLNGGASIALAETVASTAANLTLNPSEQMCVGLEINGNHISSCRDGFVEATAKALHLGKTTQVWEILIRQQGKLVCVSRMTAAVLNRAQKSWST